MKLLEHITENKHVLMVLVGKPEGNRPLEVLRPRCKNNIKMTSKDIVCRGIWNGSIHLEMNCGLLQIGNRNFKSLKIPEISRMR
jgi:hypothetical protein